VGRCLGRSGELLQPARRVAELVAIDVRVGSHGRNVGVAEARVTFVSIPARADQSSGELGLRGSKTLVTGCQRVASGSTW
jgi:hypothetical protein